MKLALQMTAASFTAMLLASCGTGSGGSFSGNHPSGTGPFDSRGNYVEEWADNPSKWKRGGGGVPAKPGESLAMNDEPPPNSVPIPTAENTRQPGAIASTPVSAPKTVRTTAARKSTSSSKSRPKSSVASRSKAKKPTVSRYTIRRGDTLSAIAARNRTTVRALQRANGIKGSLILPGKTLVIPR